MGPSESQQAAIARVEVEHDGETVAWGTAFLVSADGLVLTASHVLFDHDAKTKPPPRRPGKILLYFATGSHSPPPFVEAEEQPEHVDLDADWVLLRCKAPPDTEPLRLVEPTAWPAAPAWATFGYATGGDKLRGKSYEGTVKSVLLGAQLELESPDLPAGAKAQGLSGAPTIVRGDVVGVLRARPGDGKILAVRAGAILKACPHLDTKQMPFESEFADALEEVKRATLRRMADTLDLPPAELVDECRLHGNLARRMLRHGPLAIAQALIAHARSSPPLKSCAPLFLDLAESLWVREEAATELGGFIKAPAERSAAAINTLEGRAGRHYIVRAGDAKKKRALWEQFFINLDGVRGEDDDIVAIVREALPQVLGWGPDKVPTEEQLKARVASVSPIVVIQDVTANHTIGERLAKDLPGLRVVLLTGASLTADAEIAKAKIAYIRPEIEPDDIRNYEHACQMCDIARGKLGIAHTETS